MKVSHNNSPVFAPYHEDPIPRSPMLGMSRYHSGRHCSMGGSSMQSSTFPLEKHYRTSLHLLLRSVHPLRPGRVSIYLGALNQSPAQRSTITYTLSVSLSPRTYASTTLTISAHPVKLSSTPTARSGTSAAASSFKLLYCGFTTIGSGDEHRVLLPPRSSPSDPSDEEDVDVDGCMRSTGRRRASSAWTACSRV